MTIHPVHPHRTDWRGAMASIPGWLCDEEAELLHERAWACAPLGRLVEIGSFLGRSTVCLAAALETCPGRAHHTVLAIDPHDQPPWAHPAYTPAPGRTREHDGADPLEAFMHNMRAAGLAHRIEVARARSSQACAAIVDPVGLAFIDGEHTECAASQDLSSLAQVLHPAGELLVHDYGSWAGVTAAVDRHAARPGWRLVGVTGSIAQLARTSS